jgi:signal transduction histidine kinase
MHSSWDVAEVGEGPASPAASGRGGSEHGTDERDDGSRALLRIACHDLCAPLSAIHLNVQGFRVHLAAGRSPSPEKVLAFVARVERLALDASRLVNDVLALERKVPDRDQDIEVPLQSAMSFHAEALSRAGSTIIVTRDGPRAELSGPWDGRALESIFSNLLQNAIRHAPGAAITIHFSRSQDDVVVQFSDRGPGFARAGKPEAPRAGESSPLPSSHGLGMWIVERAVAGLGGTMAIRAGAKGGVAIDIRLPASRRSSQ